MKNFLKKVFYFLMIPSSVFSLFFIVFIAYLNKISDNYELNPEKEILFLGDSHIECAVNDSLIPKSLNLGKSSESYYFSYYKLKKLLENNSSIKQVYLGVSYHNVSNYYDQFITGKYSSDIAQNYYYILPVKEQAKMFYWNKGNLVLFVKSIVKIGFSKIVNRNKHSFLGGFKNNFENMTAVKSSMDKRLLFQYYDAEETKSFSELNISYLSKIVELCKQNNIKIAALNTPIHYYYHKKIPSIYKNKINEIIQLNQIKYIDLSELNLNNYDYIPDGDHFSKSGSTMTTIEIKNNHLY